MKPQLHGDSVKLFHANALLREQLHRLLPVDGDYSLVSGLLTASRRDKLNEVGDTGECPRIGIVVQGGKCMEDQGRQFHYNEAACFVDGSGSYGLNYVTKIPYLSLALGLDRHIIRQLLIENTSPTHPGCSSPGEVAGITDSGIVAAFSRLITLAGQPEQIHFLAPLIIKEIHYRVLSGPLGEKVRTLAFKKAGNRFCARAWGNASGNLLHRQ